MKRDWVIVLVYAGIGFALAISLTWLVGVLWRSLS